MWAIAEGRSCAAGRRHLADGRDAAPRADRALDPAAALGLPARVRPEGDNDVAPGPVNPLSARVRLSCSPPACRARARAGRRSRRPGRPVAQGAGALVLVVARRRCCRRATRSAFGRVVANLAREPVTSASPRDAVAEPSPFATRPGALGLDRVGRLDLGAGVAVAAARAVQRVRRGVQVLRHATVGAPGGVERVSAPLACCMPLSRASPARVNSPICVSVTMPSAGSPVASPSTTTRSRISAPTTSSSSSSCSNSLLRCCVSKV